MMHLWHSSHVESLEVGGGCGDGGGEREIEREVCVDMSVCVYVTV